MHGQVLIFANPISGRGKGRRAAAAIDQFLRSRGYQTQVFLSRADSLQAELAGPVRAAVVIGGDGTLRGVAQWAVDFSRERNPHPAAVEFPLLIVPTGTANLMGRHLGIAWSEQRLGQQVADALEHGRVIQLDVARINGGIFLLMAGIGFDATVVHELDRLRSGPIDLTSYLLPAAKALAGYPFPSLTVWADEQLVFPAAPALAMVGNVREYGTGFPILPFARPDDGLLDVCVMPCRSHAELIRIAMAAAVGEHTEEEGVVYCKARRMRIESPTRVPVQVDGEAAGTTPVEIDLLPGRIGFIVPPHE